MFCFVFALNGIGLKFGWAASTLAKASWLALVYTQNTIQHCCPQHSLNLLSRGLSEYGIHPPIVFTALLDFIWTLLMLSFEQFQKCITKYACICELLFIALVIGLQLQVGSLPESRVPV